MFAYEPSFSYAPPNYIEDCTLALGIPLICEELPDYAEEKF